MNKQGIEMTVVAIILVLATFVVAGIFFKNLVDISRENVDRSVCGTAIQLGSAKQSVTKLESDIKGKCDTEVKDINSKKKEEVMESIALEMYWCYAHIGQGKLDFTSNFDFWFEQNSCLYCAIMVFGEDTRKLEKIEGYEFKDYLINHPIPGNDKKSYADYFGITSYTQDQDNSMDFSIHMTIDLTHNLEIFDYMQKQSGVPATITGIAGVPAGAAVFLFTPAGFVTSVAVAGVFVGFGIYDHFNTEDTIEDKEYVAVVSYAKSGEFVAKQCTVLN